MTINLHNPDAPTSDELTHADCLNSNADCKGATEYRMPLSGTGKSFPRCDFHWSERLDIQQGIDERYPHHAPADFDPYYAGEAWGEDDY